jgi:hypothetical protein
MFPETAPLPIFNHFRDGTIKGLWLVCLIMLRGLLLMLQAAQGDGLSIDPFSLRQDCLAAGVRRKLAKAYLKTRNSLRLLALPQLPARRASRVVIS